ncbi:hypothetical protein [Dactylosporangium salmoneum]|uniref:Lipoprotein n=1 Tax=Dactylosporangium salmoneum TaxID=53361 RepID=A0ABN3G1R8_9ACTN
MTIDPGSTFPSRTKILAILGAAAATLTTLAGVSILAACSSVPSPGEATPSVGPSPRPARTDAVCTAPYGFTPPTPTSSDEASILEFATRLHPSTDDGGSGDHTYVRYRLATAQPAGTDDRAADLGTVAGFVVVDYEYWISDRHGGAAAITHYPAGAADPQPGTPGASTEHHTYPPNRIYPRFPTPFIGDRTAAPVPSLDPHHTDRDGIRDAVALTEVAAMPCQQRVVVLAGLAATGVTYQGGSTDRAGRPGIAITAGIGNTAGTADVGDSRARDTLILDPDTGTILSYEQQTMPAPGSAGPSRTTLYLLFYANRRTTLPAWATSSPPA